MPDPSRLHMLRLRASPPALVRLAKARNLPLNTVDEGYMGHLLLSELFGDRAPKPFVFRGRDEDGYTLLAYSESSLDELRPHAEAFAAPEAHAVIQWEEAVDKPMPQRWPSEMRMSFELRACPVVTAHRSTEHYSKGSEVDAFLTRCSEADDDEQVSRGAVYADWLAGQLERRGDVVLEGVRMKRFTLDKLYRRRHDRSQGGRSFTRPIVDFAGTLRSGDPDAFHNLLRRGVGQHRSFGFGMLLLRSAT